MKVHQDVVLPIVGGLVIGLLILGAVLMLGPSDSVSEARKVEALEARVATLETADDERAERLDELIVIVDSMVTLVEGLQSLYEARFTEVTP